MPLTNFYIKEKYFSYLLLCSRLPQTWQLKTAHTYYLMDSVIWNLGVP